MGIKPFQIRLNAKRWPYHNMETPIYREVTDNIFTMPLALKVSVLLLGMFVVLNSNNRGP